MYDYKLIKCVIVYFLLISDVHELCLFFTVNVTVSFTHATYNYTKLYVEITYVFDMCKVEFSFNKCTIIFL